MKAILDATDDVNISWRLCFIVPLVLHLLATLFIWRGNDLPDGSYKKLEAAGAKQKSKGAGNVTVLGFTNTNALIMLLTYGLCFGVELCMNNKLVPYLHALLRHAADRRRPARRVLLADEPLRALVGRPPLGLCQQEDGHARPHHRDVGHPVDRGRLLHP